MQCLKIFALIAVFVSAAFLFGCTADGKAGGSAETLEQLKTPIPETPSAKETQEPSIYAIQFESSYPAIGKKMSGFMEIDMGTREFCITNMKKEAALCIYGGRHYLITNIGGNCSGTYAEYENAASLDAKRCSLVSNPLVFKDQLYPFVFTLCKNHSNIVGADEEEEYLRMRNDIGTGLSTRLNSSETEVLLEYAAVEGLAIPSMLEWKEGNETAVKTTYIVTGKLGKLGLLDGMESQYGCKIEAAQDIFTEIG
ncbi:MAG: hypothetical protein WC588_02010 [Candidatus Micrarchaeia archaeon]